MLSSVRTSEGKAVDSSEYNRYTYKGDDLTTVLYRNGTTILFATGADKDTVNKVVTALGLLLLKARRFCRRAFKNTLPCGQRRSG